MKRCILIPLLVMVLAVTGQAQALTDNTQPVKIKRWYNIFRVNAFDKDGAYHGRWKIYINNEQDLVRNGRFKHGKEVGTWRYYYPKGGLYMVEKYKRRSDLISVKKYHENGKLAKTGQARMITTADVAHYYWEGEWQVYDQQGRYTHTETYLKGNLISKNVLPATR